MGRSLTYIAVLRGGPSRRLERVFIGWSCIIFSLDREPLKTPWTWRVIIIKMWSLRLFPSQLRSPLSTQAQAFWPEQSGFSLQGAGGRFWHILDKWFFFSIPCHKSTPASHLYLAECVLVRSLGSSQHLLTEWLSKWISNHWIEQAPVKFDRQNMFYSI